MAVNPGGTGPTPATPPPNVVDAVVDLWRAAGGQHWLAVAGQSMLPLLRAGDEVLVQHGPHAPRRGDLAVVRLPAGLLAHRVLAAGESLITQGDNNHAPDPPLPPEAILGWVVARRRAGVVRPLDRGLPALLGRGVAALHAAAARLGAAGRLCRAGARLLRTAIGIYAA
jgi:hypothetical protein